MKKFRPIYGERERESLKNVIKTTKITLEVKSVSANSNIATARSRVIIFVFNDYTRNFRARGKIDSAF